MDYKENPSGLPPTVLALVDRFSEFPGVGRKSALRMAMHVLRSHRDFVRHLSEAMLAVKDKIASCNSCGSLSEEDPCPICADPRRDHTLVCVVEEPRDMLALERGAGWRGVYHILGGALSPLDGVGPDQLRLDLLAERVKAQDVKEVVIATNPTSEGETTALYIARMLRSSGVRVTRIARGVPLGADLELVDDSTLQQSLAGRVEMKA
ncbi:MAG: recombination mediator RecR [Calditrichota bacterium]